MTIPSRELTLNGPVLPALFTSNQDAARRFVGLFTANIQQTMTIAVVDAHRDLPREKSFRFWLCAFGLLIYLLDGPVITQWNFWR